LQQCPESFSTEQGRSRGTPTLFCLQHHQFKIIEAQVQKFPPEETKLGGHLLWGPGGFNVTNSITAELPVTHYTTVPVRHFELSHNRTTGSSEWPPQLGPFPLPTPHPTPIHRIPS